MSPFRRGHLRILVFTDSDHVLSLLRQWFSLQGHTVFGAYPRSMPRDAEAAGALLGGIGPDLVIYDVTPPYPSGCRVFRDLRDAGVFSHVPLLVTAQDARAAAAGLGGQDAFVLTGSPENLRALMARAVQVLEPHAPSSGLPQPSRNQPWRSA